MGTDDAQIDVHALLDWDRPSTAVLHCCTQYTVLGNTFWYGCDLAKRAPQKQPGEHLDTLTGGNRRNVS